MMIYNHDAEIAHWVANGLDATFPDGSRAIGVGREGKIIAGVVYHDFRYDRNVEMSIYSTTPRWATKEALYHFFAYPFIQLNYARVTAVTTESNKHTQRFLDRLGFTQEGILRDATHEGDAVIYGLLKHECRYLKYGQEVKQSATGS